MEHNFGHLERTKPMCDWVELKFEEKKYPSKTMIAKIIITYYYNHIIIIWHLWVFIKSQALF